MSDYSLAGSRVLINGLRKAVSPPADAAVTLEGDTGLFIDGVHRGPRFDELYLNGVEPKVPIQKVEVKSTAIPAVKLVSVTFIVETVYVDGIPIVE